MKKNLRKPHIDILLVPIVILIMVLIIIPTIIYGLESNISSTSLNIPQLALASSANNPKPILLDPNPSLIDNSGNLKNNVTQAANIKDIRNGTVADGVSKLLILSEVSVFMSLFVHYIT
jgi:ABC-type lipoprotein release transport system permease subunit